MSPTTLVDFVFHNCKLQVIAITDHNSIRGGLEAKTYLNKKPGYHRRLDVIVGSEIKAKEGHILGLFLEEDIKPYQSAIDTINEIHAQGGIAIAAHPFSHWLAWQGMTGVGFLIRNLPFDAIETRNSSFSEIYSNYGVEFMNRIWQNKPTVGGSDGYTKKMIGKAYTKFYGYTGNDLLISIKTGCVSAGGVVCSPVVMLELLRKRSRSLKNKTIGWE